MNIANPIYDVVFKYLFEDNQVAKLFLSAIIGKEITELKEQTADNSTPTVCYFDFLAKIKTQNGLKTVIIELQKATYQTDLIPSRKKLGLYNTNNKFDDTQEKAQKIYSIYFLEFGMDLPECPVLKIFCPVRDVFTGEEIPDPGDFFSEYNHWYWIVQIGQLKQKRRNVREKILSVFDQSNLTGSTKQFLDVDEETFPEEYRQIIQRLQKATEDPKTRRNMELVDGVVKEIQD